MVRSMIHYLSLLSGPCLLLSACISLQPFKVVDPSVAQPQEGSQLNASFSIIVNQTQVKIQQSKVIILTLFTPECSPCGQIVRQLNILTQKIPSTSLALYGVCIEPNGCVRLNDFESAYRPDFTLGIIESSFRPSSLEKTLPFGSVQAVPITYLLTEDGTLIESFVGSIPVQYVIKQVSLLLSNDQDMLDGGKD